MARTLNNTGMAGRLRQIQEQQQGNGGGEGQPQPQPNAPQLNAAALKNRRVTMGRTPTPPPAPQPIRLGDYQATSSAIDPRNIVQLPTQQNDLQARLQASIPSVTAPRSYTPSAQDSGASWVDMSAEQRASILSDPDFYKSNAITKYDAATQQQILADPSFNWDNLPKWQRWYYSLSSNPAAMGAVQGLVMGAGNPGGAILGGTLGWASSVLGYDPNKEFWQQGDSKFTFDANQAQEAARGAFGLLNWSAEQVEKGIGLGVQAAASIANPEKYGTLKDVFTKEGWNAGSIVFENLSQNISGAQQVLLGALQSGDPLGYIEELHANAPKGSVLEKALLGAVGYVSLPTDIMLGAQDRVTVDDSNFLQRMADIRNQVKDGQNYREVMSQMQTGILAQVGDMAGQGIADPLNFVGQAKAKAGEVTARISGDKIAAEAFSQAEGYFDAQKRIQNIVKNPAEALKIDPNYKVNEMGWITKALADLTPEGKIKGGLLPSAGALLDYTPPKKNIMGFIESMTSLTSESRARVGQDLLVRNLGSVMASYFGGTDVKGFAEWWKAFSNGDMTQSAELSNAMAQSPEFYTVLPAAKGFDIGGRLALWEQSEPARMAVSRIADVLGENPTTFIEDLTKRGTGPEDFARVTELLKQSNAPEARALLAEIEAGRFTAADLTDAVKAFSDGSVPFHPGQWMAETLDAIKDHYDQWAVDHFKLEEEARKTLFRVSAVMKSAQSILLLGANPGYFISNVLPTMVTRAASGVYGYMTPTAIDNFFSRMGFSLEDGFAPSRLEEGVGPSGMIDQTRQTGDAIREATLGKGKLTDIQRALGKIGSAMPFNKLSRLLEGYEGKQAYAIGIKKFWGESWRRGTGFREIPKALLTELTNTVGPRAAEMLYANIESGMTKAEIMNIVNERSSQIKSRGLVNEAAQALNIPASKAASMLEQMGVLDQLDANLKNATTQGRVEAAFKKARETAQAEIDRQASRDAIARIEHIMNRIQTEGPKAITDLIMDTEMQSVEKWMDHYERMGEAAEAMDSIADADARSKLWSLKYAESNAEYRRHSAVRGSTYLGILKAMGLDAGEAGRGWLSTIGDTDRVLDNAYRTMRDLRDEHFRKWNNDWDNPRQAMERGQIESKINQVWKDATKTETRNLAKMGEFLALQYEQLFGAEAGEAARQAWEQISAFRKEMVTRRDDFRASLEGVPAARRQVMSKEFWQNNYNYMVIEMGRIKQEAISNLDRIARNGGDQTTRGAGTDPNNPQGGAPNVNPELEALRQQAQERARIQKEKVNAIWDIAEQYSKKLANNSSNFDRGYQYDKLHLEATLRKAEYGGDPTIKDLKDAAERLTPEQIKEILDNRENVKSNEAAAYAEAQAQRFAQEMQDAARRAANRKTAENLTILQNIRKRGGIDIASWMNFGDKPEGYQPGVFSREGKNRWALDQMAQLLADDGYPIDVNDPADVGGINQLIDLVQRARAGKEIFPAGHEFIIDEAVNKAQADYIEQMAKENTFDADQWLDDSLIASITKDRAAMDSLIENLPDELLDQNITAQETYREYIERVSSEIDTNLASDEQVMNIAENQVRAEAAVKQQEATANTTMTRQLFRERLQEAFGLNEDMTDTVMNITDARAESWAAIEGGTADDWYATRIADVVKDGGNADLAQEAWHGSPYKFDQFTLDHMGSGEGAQAYGWGLYFAGDRAVADWYRKKLSGEGTQRWEYFFKGNKLEEGSPQHHAAGLVLNSGKSLASLRKEVMGWITEAQSKVGWDKEISGWQQTLDILNEATSKKDFIEKKPTGQLYKVEIPDENYLLWDKPLSEQPESVRNAITELVKNTLDDRINNEPDYHKASQLSKYEIYKNGNYEAVVFDGAYYDNGQALYKLLENTLQSDKAASLALKEAGINGIQYLDGSSRGKGEGSYNYVIFDDAAIQIKETYYQAETQAIGPDGRPVNAKGGVQFLDDGKAIIRAFQAGDVSTAVHEIGHIFRRDLQGTDLAIIESWAEVKNGQWTREAEEKFARGFEKYLADGSAPTPKLKMVFEKFKTWMVNIYRTITGSPIDIELNAAVKEVFDRLLVGNERVKQVDVGDMLTQLGYDPKTYYLNESGRIVRRPELNIRVDQTARTQAADEIIGNMQEKLNALKRGEPVRVGQTVDPATPTPPKNTSTWKMNYEEYKASLLQEQKDFATRRIEQIKRGEFRDNLHIDEAKELARMEAMLSRNTVSYEMFGDSRESYRKSIEKALIDNQPVPDEIKQAYYAMGKEGNLSQAEYKNLQQAGRTPEKIGIGKDNSQPETLFQEADPRMPIGGYEEAAGWLPQSQVMDEGWNSEVQPLLDKMQEAATNRLKNPQMDGAYKDLSPEGQRMLQQYLNGVTNDMASTKMAAQRWGAQKRDDVGLNYNKRYGFDKMLDVVFPYQFFYTRSMMTWAQRALDHPAWLSNYARIRRQQDRYENNLPERLRGKMRIDAPWLPDWMGDGLYIDPLSVLFTPHNFLRPFEQMSKDRNMQVIEAERILQEWAADGVVPQDQIVQAAQTRSGSTWERAIAEAKLRREAEISNPMDFVSTMFGPAWYLTTPAKLLNIGKDGPQTLTELPLTRTARAVDTVTNNTWAEPIGNIVGLLAKPEEAFREAADLPKFGEYGDYYTDRAIANMVAEGLITSEDAQIAMIERQGEIFNQAQERVKLELAMRVPLAGLLYAGLNEGVAAAAQAAAPSLFGAGILPEGELKYRGLKQEWNEAWAKRDAGDTQAINRFFEKHPEYEAYLAKGKEPQDRLRTFLIGQIWDGYMQLGETDRKQATADMGDLFKQAFINPETRAYDTLDIDTLTQWAQMVNKRVPNVEQTAPAIANPRKVNYLPQDVTAVTDTFFSQRKRLYGDYYELEQGYYNLPRSERASYLIANPKLKNYWEWKDGWYQRYPDLVPVFKGQVFKRIDTSTWPIGLEDYVSAYALGGEKLPNGAYKALQQVWINEGMPMGDLDTWLKSQVVPAMMYQEGAIETP